MTETPRMRRSQHVLLLLLLVSWGALPPAGAAAEAPERAKAILRRAVERRIAMRSLYAEAAMRIVDERQHFTLGVNCRISVRKPHDLRIQASKMMGRMDVFDAVVIGDRIGILVPRDDALYHGRVSELDPSRLGFHPEEVARQLLLPENHLLERTWTVLARREDPTARWRSRRNEQIVLQEETSGDGVSWRVVVEEDDLLRVERRDAAGDLVFVKEYDDYRPVGDAAGPPELGGGGRLFPFRVRMDWPAESRWIKIAFKTVEPDAAPGDEVFAIEYDPDTVRLLPLEEVRVESDGEPAGNAP